MQNHPVLLLQVLLLQLLNRPLQAALLLHRLLLVQILVLLLQLLNRSLQAALRLVQILVLLLQLLDHSVQVALVLVVLKDLQSQAQTKTPCHPQNLQPRSSTHPLSSHSLIQRHRRPWLTLILLTS